MAPKKDLVALTTKKALAEKVAGKWKSPAPTDEERGFHCLRRGPRAAKVVQPAAMEKVGEDVPSLAAMMAHIFLLKSPAGEGSSRSDHAARERIRWALLTKDVKVFEQVLPKGLTKCLYDFSNFVSKCLPTS